eukprot:TRINITY_DN110986_c0_g1_i1.p1 TRINITY_DN110986_c0_g1~~TRINITY_DN110986_c0_g1_i1.p1  ORF type:complete len:394 (+),score=36.97 TRINITY_DN110986_c0_g1_i1:47-1228(+)
MPPTHMCEEQQSGQVWEWETWKKALQKIVLKAPTTILNPNDLHFTHLSVSPLFSCGRDVRETAKWVWLTNDRSDPLALRMPPLVVVRYQERLWSRSNRRLKCFKLAGLQEVRCHIVSMEDLDEKHCKWFKCHLDNSHFENGCLDTQFYPYSDCEICRARCRGRSNLRRHMRAVHLRAGLEELVPPEHGQIVAYNRLNGTGKIRSTDHVGDIKFFWMSLPKQLRYGHHDDFSHTTVAFGLWADRSGRKCAWGVKLLSCPARDRAEKLNKRQVGVIESYNEERGFGFISPGHIFYHRSQLPYQLARCQKEASLVGAELEYDLVEDEDGKVQAKRHVLLLQPVHADRLGNRPPPPRSFRGYLCVEKLKSLHRTERRAVRRAGANQHAELAAEVLSS